MEIRRERADALMYRTTGNMLLFCWPPCDRVRYYEWLGWRLLIRQDHVKAAYDEWRAQDIDDTRRLDEQGPGGR